MTTNTKHTDDRAKFEAWIAKEGGDLRTFGSGENMHYHNSAVNNAWGGWKAAYWIEIAQTEAARVPDGINLVRYCHECGHVGEQSPKYGTCCPDGHEATYVHREVADQARLGFLSLIERESMKGEEGAHA